MNIIEIQRLDNGAHRNQTVSGRITPPEGWAVIPADMELPDTFPFIDLTVEDGKITAITANREAYDAARADEPEPQPTTEDRVTALEEALAQTDETAIELYEAQAEQEAINAAQDEALIEIYEMIGG